MTEYKVVWQISAHGGESPLPENRIEALMDALLDVEAADDEITDPDVAGSLATAQIDIQMIVEADDPAQAATKALCAIRSAIHAVGDSTPGWELAQSQMRVAPAQVLTEA